jgi:hypothetical protein
MYTMRITINGQLLLTMLIEWLIDEIEGIVMLQANTDGITIKIPRNAHQQVMEICKRWEKLTGMILEYGEYRRMVIRDVNNYLAQTMENDVKPKGCFEIIPMQNGAVGYNKNWSMRVVPKALHAHYIQGVPIEDYITQHDNIYDFCIGFRARKGWNNIFTHVEQNKKIEIPQQRTIRYFMSKTGGSLTKKNFDDKRVISLEAGKTCTMFNQAYFTPMSDYNIDYGFYIAKANKIKCAVWDGQIQMF